MTNPRGAVTITDVANAAGVSASTVSYVITGKRTISAATRRRVEETIRTLGYRRRGVSPASTPAGVLAVAIPLDRHLGVAMEFFAAAAGTARELGFDLLLVTDDTGTAGLHRVTSAALADAVIVLDAGDDDPRVPVLLASGRPAVLVGRHRGPSAVPLDFAPAGQACATHLADLGHRSIAHLTPSVPDRLRYLAGFREAAAHRRLEALSLACAPEDVPRYLDELLTRGGPTALVVHDEAVLPPLLAELGRRGLRVPGDVSVVAVCSATAADHQRLRPTAVVVPARELGVRAVELAVRRLDGMPVAEEPEPVVPPLVVGETTGPPGS
ncbi:LacI family DNA-binding transcriptional regulator [Amycolatopsis lexingtonensis]|uniref:LacI family DNA-binding transcriptional regulator n=1 Tax=Amycolatopsis lexingtonensis TaxID=218822 RepID=UPI003F71EC6D